MNKDDTNIDKNEITLVEDISAEKLELDNAALQIIKQTIVENDVAKTKDLTSMFNTIQKKKAMVRIDKLNNLLDVITDQAIERFTMRPDELSNQELFQGLKTIQDIAEKNQKMLVDQTEQQPLIQINQQEVNIGAENELDRVSRDKVKNAVANILAGIANQANKAKDETIVEAEIVDATFTENTEGEQKDE